MHKSEIGTSRHFAATQDVCRFRSEADVSRLVGPGQSVENDPERTSLSILPSSVARLCCANLGSRQSDTGAMLGAGAP